MLKESIKPLVPEWVRRLARRTGPSLRQQVADARCDLQGVRERLDSVSAVQAQLPTELEAARQLIADLRGRIGQLSTELCDLRARVEWMAGFQGQLSDRMGTAEGSLTGVWGEVVGLRQYTTGLRETYPGLWWKDNLFELTVAVVLQDLCRPGTVVWDCGANVGGLSVLMSRLVGPRGIVCSFEASPRVMDECLRNVVMNGCGNVTLYHAAIFHSSDQTIPIYYGHHTQSDSVVAGKDPAGSGQCVRVPTLALDDFARRTGLTPDVVKMDIEGAEYDALIGMRETIGSARPHLVLETDTGDDRCLNLLREMGYTAIDVGSYREVCSAADYPPRSELRNLLYVHESRLDEAGYRPPFELVECGRLGPADFESLPNGSLRQRVPLELSAGRYLVEVDAEAAGTDNQMMCGVRSRGAVIQMYWCDTAHVFKSYRDWVFCLPEPSPSELFFEYQGGTTDPTFAFRGAVVRRLARFDSRPRPRVN